MFISELQNWPKLKINSIKSYNIVTFLFGFCAVVYVYVTFIILNFQFIFINNLK